MSPTEIDFDSYLAAIEHVAIKEIKSRPHLKPFLAWAERVFAAARNESLRKAFMVRWRRFSGTAAGKIVAPLLALEINAVVEAVRRIVKGSRPATRQDVLNAAGVSLESIMEDLILPPTVRGVLNTVKEVVAVAKG